MTILVTGGCGYIGSHMVHALARRREQVVVIDNLSTGFPQALPDGVELVRGDIADTALVADTLSDHGIEAIAHFAGSIVVPDSVADPLGYYANNTVASHGLIRAAVAAGVGAFLFSSTAAVYGEAGADPISEDAPTEPVNPYGWSKLMTETMLRHTTAAHGMAHACLRYFNVAGADPEGETGQSTPRATHLIKVASQAALGQRDGMAIFGTDYPTPDGTCIRDYIHVSDLIEAHVLALDHLRGGGESLTFNCGYGHGFSVREVIAAVRRVSGAEFEVREEDRRAGDPAMLVAAAERIRAELGWQPQHDDLDTIVAHALAWERSLAQKNWRR